MAPFDRSYALRKIRKFNATPYKYRRGPAPPAVKSQARALIRQHANIIKAKLQRRRWRRVITAARHKKMQTRNFRRQGYVTSKRAPLIKIPRGRRVPWQVPARKRTRMY